MADIKEWSPNREYNPFNSNKLLAHVARWGGIKRGENVPAPVLVTVDPINACNYKCVWCNAEYILGKNTGKISDDVLDSIAEYLPSWDSKTGWGVDAVCIAGGGEPLIHPYVGKFVEKLAERGVESGIVTNGLYIDRHVDYLADCTWIGVSVDCASQETLKELKGAKSGDFNKTIKGIGELVSLGGTLGQSGQGHGVSYKYLLHPGNVGEVYEAAKLAKETGCRNFHLRPFGASWDKVGSDGIGGFSYGEIEKFREQITHARELEDDSFGVFGITHKFDGNFEKSNRFKECYAIFMTGVFMPPTSDSGKFDFGVCCDRRGDDRLTLKDLVSTSGVSDFWGAEEHWGMFDKIRPEKCPRCTYQPHNIIHRDVVKKDNMSWKFI